MPRSILLFLSACKEDTPPEVIIPYNSKAYHEKFNDFNFDITSALEIASKVYFSKEEQKAKFSYSLEILIGDYYIFYSHFYFRTLW